MSTIYYEMLYNEKKKLFTQDVACFAKGKRGNGNEKKTEHSEMINKSAIWFRYTKYIYAYRYC